jgi:hypothetical protein
MLAIRLFVLESFRLRRIGLDLRFARLLSKKTCARFDDVAVEWS